MDAMVIESGIHSQEQQRHDAARPQPELLEWLRSGRLTLLDRERQPVEIDGWGELSADSRAQALAEFQRVVRGNAKAAVLFLK